MAETVRDVIIRISLKQIESKLKAPDMGPIEKSLDRYEKQVAEVTKKIDGHYSQVEKSVEATAKKTEQVGQAAFKTGIATAEGFKKAGEGAFILARGVAFLSSNSDESFREMLENVAKVQGAFDLFKGGVDTVDGLGKAIEGLGGKSAILSKIGSMVPMLFTPWGVVIGAAVAGLGALAAAWASTGEEAETSFQKMTRALGPLDSLRSQLSLSRNSSGRRNELLELQLGGDREAMLQNLRAGDAGSYADFQNRQRDIATQRDIAMIQLQNSNDPEYGKKAEQIRNDAAIAQAENRLQLAEELENSSRRQLDIQREQKQLAEQERAAKQAQLDVAQQLLAAEQDRIRTNQGAIGRLNGEDMLRLERLTSKVEQQGIGSLNREDASFLDRTGVDFLRNRAQDVFVQQGGQRGIERIRAAFGDTDDRDKLQGQIQNFEQQIKGLNESSAKLPEEIAKTAAALTMTINKTLEEMKKMQWALDDAERVRRAQ